MMLPVAFLPFAAPHVPEMLTVLVAMGLNRKLFFPWHEEKTDSQTEKKLTDLKATIRLKDDKISQLERENAELKCAKTVHVTQIGHVSTYVEQTNAVLTNVTVIANDPKNCAL